MHQIWYLIASHTTDYRHSMLFLNTLAVIVLVVAKFPNMHKVRIFGINADHGSSYRGKLPQYSRNALCLGTGEPRHSRVAQPGDPACAAVAWS
ncbi:hypothetical protein Taro_004814 [Colocasia esculenta]|uniref:Uncharacterized protein n=1 Tax=Colocasia esculenta TaxID=4460 RepID=A0A843TSS4_COLES|nr:hypothetical protein [Colocasia esculenta]